MSMKFREKKEFERLFKDNYNRLYYYALNIIHSSENAKDIVSDAFHYLWEHYEEVDESLSVLSLLYTSVRNRCVDHLRHLDVRDRYGEYIMNEAIRWTENEYDEYDEQMVRVINSIEKLPPQTKAVFKKCFLEGKKYAEVSKEMSISINTVKTHIMKALKLLRYEFVR
jgi:RNA polymerase sigma-70 factor (family 1)